MTRKRQRLAQRRKAVGLSQEQLAEILGVDRSTVVRWERADNEPQPWHRPRLAKALRISTDDLAVLLAAVDVTPVPAAERLTFALEHPEAVDLVTVAHLRKQIQRLDEQYDRASPASLLADCGYLHGQVLFLRTHADASSVRRELAAARIESATLIGQLVWDASQRRDHVGAMRYFNEAIAAARQVHDPVAEAHAELRKSYVALYGQNDPRTGLLLAERAAAVSAHDSPVLSGLAQLHVGEAYAMLGDARPCDVALGNANANFDRHAPDDPAAMLFCTTLSGRLTGSCLLSLGQPAKAESVLDHTRTLLKPRRKAAAILLGNLALARIRQRKMDEAVGALHEAIDVVEQTRGGGGLNVVFQAMRELRPWNREQPVHEVNDRVFALMATA